MIDARHVSMAGIFKRFGAAYALRDVDFEADAGEIHALVGENGAGKSTLRPVLAGALPADAGRLEVDGGNSSPGSPHDARRLGIRAVHQEFSLVPQLTVVENIFLGELPTRGRGVWTGRRSPVADEAIGSLGVEASTRTSASTGWVYPSSSSWRSPRRSTALPGRHPGRALGRPVASGARAALRRPARPPCRRRHGGLRVAPSG